MNAVHLPALEADRKAWRLRLGIDEAAPSSCMVANLHDDKEHKTLLRAWRVVLNASHNHAKDPVLLTAGQFDNSHEKLKALAYDLELGQIVRFLERLLRDGAPRKKEGERNRRPAARVFRIEQMCAETTEVIAGLLNNEN